MYSTRVRGSKGGRAGSAVGMGLSGVGGAGTSSITGSGIGVSSNGWQAVESKMSPNPKVRAQFLEISTFIRQLPSFGRRMRVSNDPQVQALMTSPSLLKDPSYGLAPALAVQPSRMKGSGPPSATHSPLYFRTICTCVPVATPPSQEGCPIRLPCSTQAPNGTR